VELLHVWNPNHLAGSGAVHPRGCSRSGRTSWEPV
jgi:hypothetical protein